MIITSCPSAEQVSILLSSASIIAAEAMVNFSAAQRKLSVATSETAVGVEPTTVSSEADSSAAQTSLAKLPQRKISLDKRVSFEESSQNTMDNLAG